MSRGRMRRLAAIAGTTLAMSTYGLAVAPSAFAGVACVVSGTTLQVSATAADVVGIQLDDVAIGGSREVLIDDTVNPTTGSNVCAGTPLLANVTAINVTGDGSTAQTVALWLSDDGGQLRDWGAVKFNVNLGADVSADGLLIYNADADFADEIDVAMGVNGADLDNDGVVDVTPSGVDRFEIGSESDGDDVISAAGSEATGAAFPGAIQGLDGPGTNPGIWSASSSGDSGDTLTGGAGNDEINGYAGYATCAGGLGDDSITCDAVDYSASATAVSVNLPIAPAPGTAVGEGLDTLNDVYEVYGSDLNDTIVGNADDNWIWGGGGDDALTGGTGVDTASYLGSNGVEVDLGAGTATGDHGSDTLTGFENAEGGRGADKLKGVAGADNVLSGEGGNDKLNGKGGDDLGATDDTLEGGNGIDTASYKWADSVIVALATDTGANDCDVTAGVATPEDHGDDVLDSIENAKLTSGDDSFTGSQFQNKVWPMGGQNTLTGDCAADAGGDVLDYAKGYGSKGVTVNMAGGATAGDAATGFEAAIGSNGDDFFTGNEKSNSIDGGNGADVIRGGDGDDDIDGGKGPDSIRAGSGDDTIMGGKGRDEGFGGNGDDWGKSLEVAVSIELGPSA